MKSKVQKDESIGYRITQIKTHKITIVEPDDINLEKITITGNLNVMAKEIDESKAEIIFDVVTEFFEPKIKEVLISHIGRTKYVVQNLTSAADKESFNIPDELLIMLYSMAHSHARALLASDLQNTIYKDKMFIPVINPKNILKNKLASKNDEPQ